MINLLLSLTFLFLLFIKGFKQQNTTIANILAVIFSLWLYIHQFSYYLGALGTPFVIFTTPLPSFGTLFVVGGIISKKYFSKYYGEIIIKFGIGFLIINALLLIGSSQLFDAEGFIAIFTNIVQIIFWILYFMTLSSKTNVSLVSKNDPKDW